jgi:cysteine desulfurase
MIYQITTPTAMLSRLPHNVFRRVPVVKASTSSSIVAHRGFVQPSGADRASVVDIPSTYQDEGYFSPRSGNGTAE